MNADVDDSDPACVRPRSEWKVNDKRGFFYLFRDKNGNSYKRSNVYRSSGDSRSIWHSTQKLIRLPIQLGAGWSDEFIITDANRVDYHYSETVKIDDVWTSITALKRTLTIVHIHADVQPSKGRPFHVDYYYSPLLHTTLISDSDGTQPVQHWELTNIIPKQDT